MEKKLANIIKGRLEYLLMDENFQPFDSEAFSRDPRGTMNDAIEAIVHDAFAAISKELRRSTQTDAKRPPS